MSEDLSDYVGGLLLIGFMHRLYEEYVGSSVLWLLKKKIKKSSSLKEDDNEEEEEECQLFDQ